jgi:hypothetical protein
MGHFVRGVTMKHLTRIALGSIALSALSFAAMCPEANFDACQGSDGYAIVETEAIEYIPHNQMESAHRLVLGTQDQPRKHKVHRIRRFCR